MFPGSDLPGITPAYAGKSYHVHPSGFSQRDHPRIRGEKQKTATVEERRKGSPPHTRGKEVDSELVNIQKGITPAYAGKSAQLRAKRATERDHPRIRGEKL